MKKKGSTKNENGNVESPSMQESKGHEEMRKCNGPKKKFKYNQLTIKIISH